MFKISHQTSPPPKLVMVSSGTEILIATSIHRDPVSALSPSKILGHTVKEVSCTLNINLTELRYNQEF